MPFVESTNNLPSIFKSSVTQPFTDRSFPYKFSEKKARPYSSVDHVTSFSPKQSLSELQAEIQLYKDELKKKDDFLLELSSNRIATNSLDYSFKPTGVRLVGNGVSDSIGEAAALRVKVETLKKQLEEAQREIELQLLKMKQLEADAWNSKENEAKYTALANAQQEKINYLLNQTGQVETLAGKNEVAAQMLQKECQDAKQRIAHLEDRLRCLLEEKEEAEQRAVSWEKKYSDIISHVGSLSLAEFNGINLDHAGTLSKITNIIQENAVLKGRLASLRDFAQSSEMESRCSKDTIQRLIAEIGREQQHANRYTVELDELRKERNSAVDEKCEIERENAKLRQRLAESQRVWALTRNELDRQESHLTTLDQDAREGIHLAYDTKAQCSAFREQLAYILSDEFCTVDRREDAILDKLRQLKTKISDLNTRNIAMEDRLRSTTKQLDDQLRMHRSTEKHVRIVEDEKNELNESLRQMHMETSSQAILRDGFKMDQERYQRCLERLSIALKVGRLSPRVGLDVSCDSLVRRAEELIKVEEETLNLVGANEQARLLRKKVENLKEELQSKDVHLNMLNKKVVDYESQLVTLQAMSEDQSLARSKHSKLQRLCDKFRSELAKSRAEVRHLKAVVADARQLKELTGEQEAEIDALRKELSDLEHIRQSQASKIANLKQEINFNNEPCCVPPGSNQDYVVQGLSNDLKNLRKQLADVTGREQQLLNFKRTVASICGLDAGEGLCILEADIFTKLQNIKANAMASREHQWEDMDESFRLGYSQPLKPMKRSAGPRKKKALDVDPRSY